MACSSIIERGSSSRSNSSLTQRKNYDVFISFRGEDTRNNITDLLFGALQGKCIFAFRDDKNLKKGESIAPELLHAIEGSQVFVVIFSKNYASSTWCLRELEKILEESARVLGKRVLPIFYDVDPSEVRHQKGCFDEAFKKHEERFKHDLQIVQRWREALTFVANLSGFDLRHKPHYVEIQMIVEEIIDILGYQYSSLPKDLVGIHTPIEELEKLLRLDSVDDIRVVGISGMGGIGKTTLSTILYGRISNQFNACCFIDDLSRVYKHDGPIGAQKQILYQTQSGEHLQVWNVYDGTNLIRRKLRRVRALIILDNVDQVEQLEKIGMNREWLGAGSRMIIISRDAHILKAYGVDAVFKVPILNHSHAYQLFCQKAFKLDNIMTINDKLAAEILYYANGLPLAIKVLGSFLYGRNISEWRSALARLRESPHKDIMDVLRLSFDGLEKNEKDIFLHIACFFNGKAYNIVRNVLNCCGLHPDIGLTVLNDKSLIFYQQIMDHTIKMHSLLEELGKNIVRENSVKESTKWSKVWLRKHLDSAISENMEKNVEAVVFDDTVFDDDNYYEYQIQVSMESLSKLSRLKILLLRFVDIKGSLSCLSSELRYILWNMYPFTCLPSDFQPNQLVELNLRGSKIEILWEDEKYLPKLKTLDLRHSENLIKMPNFEKIPNLEELCLKGCVKLVHMDPSIGLLRKLVVLNLKDCENLIIQPDIIFRINSLKEVNLSGCSKMVINQSSVEKPSSSMKLMMLPSCFSCLRQLDLSFCRLSKIPNSIVSCIRYLESLVLTGNNFVMLPSLKELSKLVHLDVQHCPWLKSLPELPLPPTIEQDYYIFSHPQPLRSIGLCLFNCPKLCQSEQSHKMILSWMTQFLWLNHESCDSSFQLDIVIPGSEIPRWFNNRSIGNSRLHVDLSPIMQHNMNNFIGVACYVAFSVLLVHSTTGKGRPNVGFHFGTILLFVSPVDTNKDLIKAESNHLWLCFIPLKTLDLTLNEDSDAIMQTYIRGNGNGLHVEVKSFGYHWVSKRDLQVLMHSGDLLAQKNKILKIE